MPRLSKSAIMMTLLAVARSAQAGVFGVPTNLSVDGQRCIGAGAPVASCTAASANPPGYLALDGTNVASSTGDVSHQMRFVLEVTGTTLDIKVFDPGTGTAGANGVLDTNALAVALNTRFRLYDPLGNVLGGDLNQGFDAVAGTITEGRLVRFGCNAGAPTFAAANAGTIWGAGAGACAALSPGRYVFEVTEGLGNAVNTFGVQVTNAVGAPYNIYTEGTADDAINAVAATDNSLVLGRPPAGGSNGIAAAMVVYPYVNRGCSVEAMNFDSDASGTISLVDALGGATALTVSGNDAVATDLVTVESTAGPNYRIDNYGLFPQTQTLAGAGSNFVDIRYSDFLGSTAGIPVTHPRLPVAPLRTYLPNGYSACTAAACTMTAPTEPVLTQAAVVSSGNNPPVVGLGQTTGFVVSATLFNGTADPLTNPAITIPYDPTPSVGGTAAFVSATDACWLDGVSVACTVVGGAAGGYDFRTASFVGTVGAGAAFTFQYEVIVSDITAAGSFDLTAPPSATDPVTQATYTPAFNSLAFPAVEDLGALCQLRSDTSTLTLTLARVKGVEVDATGVTFVVASQSNTRSFQVFGVTGALRAPLGSIAALVPDSMSPVLYRIEANATPFSAILLRETEISGRVRDAGEFAISDRRSERAVRALRQRLEAVGAVARESAGGLVTMIASRSAGPFARSFEDAARRAAVSDQRLERRRRRGGSALKVLVDGGGPVVVRREDLVAAGMPSSVPTRRVRVFKDGQPLALRLVAPGTRDEGLRFEASRLESRYTAKDAYVVSWTGFAPRRRSVALTLEGPALAAGFTRVEKSAIYLASAPEGADPWLWDVLVAGAGLWPYSWDPEAGNFDLPDLVPSALASLPVRVHLVGRSEHHHRVSVSINGVQVGQVSFDGRTQATVSGSIPSGELRSSGNKLTLDYAAGPAQPEDLAVVYLDSLDLGTGSTPRERVAREIERYDESISHQTADYLIVTHGDFMAEAQRVAEFKQAEGLRTAVVDVERAYDRFSAGVVEAEAVRELIRSVPGVAYVLLVGDDAIDYKDYLGASGFPIVPSIYAIDGVTGRFPSENGYADLNGDLAPDVAIGRLPVQTVAEARTLVEKLGRESLVVAEGVSRHLFVTDNQGRDDPSFRDNAARMAALFSASTEATFADLSDGWSRARSTMIESLAAGSGFTSYFGHGGPERWADEDLFTVEDVPLLLGLKETVLLMWACQSQYYASPYGPSLGEALLLLPQGGAVASIGPSAISSTGGQEVLYRELYRALSGRRPLTLGEAFRRAKVKAARSTNEARDALLGFNLLGDPALRIR